MLRVWTHSAALVLVLLAGGHWRRPGPLAAQSSFPPYLERYLTRTVKLTDAERQQLLAGAPVTRLLETDPTREVAVFGAIWIGVPMARYIAAIRNIESFERGGAFRVTKRISEPPRLEDFALLTLPEDDVADLKTCKVGKCELKLSQLALDRLRKEVDWSKPNPKAQVDRLARQLALEYVTAYREGGNDRLAVYRDGERPTFVAQELRTMIDQMPELDEYTPDAKRFLLGYPNVNAPGTSSFLYWQEAQFGLKPTIRINHVAIHERPEGVLVGSKLIYASHYFWTALELRALVPDPARGPGFWFVNVNRSRSDGLSGFVGKLIRGKVRGEARQGIELALKATRAALEAQSR
jgi:hypothetical protein